MKRIVCLLVAGLLTAAALAAPAGAKARHVVRCTVPQLKGDTLAKAKKTITKNHCKVGKVRLTGGSVDRVVTSQTPKARRRERDGYKTRSRSKARPAPTPGR